MRRLTRIRGWTEPREANWNPPADRFVVGKQRFATHEEYWLTRVRRAKVRHVRAMHKELSFAPSARCIAIEIGNITYDQATLVKFESEYSLDGKVCIEFGKGLHGAIPGLDDFGDDKRSAVRSAQACVSTVRKFADEATRLCIDFQPMACRQSSIVANCFCKSTQKVIEKDASIFISKNTFEPRGEAS